MPIQRKRPDKEYRQHTEYRVDPTTGQEIIVPALDQSGVPIQTIYGVAGIDPAAGHQPEPAMLNAGKLMGNKAFYNDPEGR